MYGGARADSLKRESGGGRQIGAPKDAVVRRLVAGCRHSSHSKCGRRVLACVASAPLKQEAEGHAVSFIPRQDVYKTRKRRERSRLATTARPMVCLERENDQGEEQEVQCQDGTTTSN